YLLQTIAVLIANRRGTIPTAEPGTFDLGKARVPVAVLAVIAFALVCAALIFLPQFAGNGYVFLGLLVLTTLWAFTGLRKRLATGQAAPADAKTHNARSTPNHNTFRRDHHDRHTDTWHQQSGCRRTRSHPRG